MRKLLSLCALCLLTICLTGANYRTTNFVVQAETPEMAREVATAAEQWRRHLAKEWLGQELPRWPRPCHVTVQADAQRAPSGFTRMLVEGDSYRVWEIILEGPKARILDSVLPHEMTHAVFATHFRKPAPRWAEEGASTVVEHPSQRLQQQRRLAEILFSGMALPLGELLAVADTEENASILYVQGYSLTQFLLTQGDKQKFVGFLNAGLTGTAWTDAVCSHYGFQDMRELQQQWLQWAMPGL